jgi:TolB-like protein/tetratricopeptide (TPR) repeat protein
MADMAVIDCDQTTGDPEEGQTTIFVSYSRADQARALPIIQLLQQAGFNTWWDGLLEGGERFSHTTEDALYRAKAVVVLWSKTSVQSHWVHDEATRGRDRGILVPLSLDGVEPPLGFGQFQVIDLSRAKMSAKDDAVQRMLRKVEALHGTDSVQSYRPPPALPAQADRRTLMAGGAAVIALGGGAAAWLAGLFGQGGAKSNRIAVLQFDNIGDKREQTYVADGIANEIRATLARNGALEVVGQASSEAFARGKDDAVAFAKKIRAGYLIDGAVQIVGDIISVKIELIDGKTGVSLSPRSFEKPIGDILSVQREIGSAVSAELSGRIGATGLAKSDPGGTKNVIAFDHYLRGKDLYANATDEAGERQAVTQFDEAIAADPKFAGAYAARARSLAAISGQYGSAAEIKTQYDAAIVSAKQAVKLAPKSADAQSGLALMLFQGKLDVKSARVPFDLSRKLGEGDAPVLARFAAYCAATRQDREALSTIDRALVLDPLNAKIHRIAGSVHYAAGRYHEAIAALRQALSIDPDLPEAQSGIGMALLMQDKNQEALKTFEVETHKWSKLAGGAIAQNRIGNRSAAKAAMAGLTGDTDTVSLYQQGQVYAQWGDVANGLAALEQAYQQRDAGLTTARVDPMLIPLRQQPRFIDLLKSMGFD